jgi:hypothetical protein
MAGAGTGSAGSARSRMFRALGKCTFDRMTKQVDGLLAVQGVDLPVLVRPSWYFENV